jgi:hypothetical protein
MEVLYIQNMKVLLYNKVYSTKIFIFPAGGERWERGTKIPFVRRARAREWRKEEGEVSGRERAQEQGERKRETEEGGE